MSGEAPRFQTVEARADLTIIKVLINVMTIIKVRLILTITKVKFSSCDDDKEKVEISYKQGSSCMLGKNIPHIMPFEILSYKYLAIFTLLPSHRRVDRRCHNLTLVSMGKDTG